MKKRILAILCFVLISIASVSCTNDNIEDTVSKNKISATDTSPGDTGSGQSGQTTTTPPKH